MSPDAKLWSIIAGTVLFVVAVITLVLISMPDVAASANDRCKTHGGVARLDAAYSTAVCKDGWAVNL